MGVYGEKWEEKEGYERSEDGYCHLGKKWFEGEQQ